LEDLRESIRGTTLEECSLEEVMTSAADHKEKAAVFNNSAQAWNHHFYWRGMRPGGGGEPGRVLAKMIEISFGNFMNFKNDFKTAAATFVGSGWIWLVADSGSLKVVQTYNADSPSVQGQKPLLTLDIWEHAYYLNYRDSREVYVTTFLGHLMNWDFVSKNLS
jgi:Fe-Mn family superoxide dismutase